MTANQLAYQRNLIQAKELDETKRANLRQEALKDLSILVDRELRSRDLTRKESERDIAIAELVINSIFGKQGALGSANQIAGTAVSAASVPGLAAPFV